MRVLEKADALRRMGVSEQRGTVHFTDAGKPPTRKSRKQKTWKALSAKRELLKERSGSAVLAIDVDLQRMARHLDMNRAQLGRSLSDLEAEGLVVIDRPERVGGVRLVHREPEPGVDMGELAERRQQDYARIQRVVDYADALTCRRKAIVDYYGEDVSWEQCGTCDVCVGGRARPQADRALSGSEMVAVDAALQCLSELRGWWAPSVPARILSGSRDQTLERMKASERYSSFGALSDWSTPQVRDLLLAMTRSGLMDKETKTKELGGQERSFHVIKLSKIARKLMGKLPSDLELPGGPFGPQKRPPAALRSASRNQDEAPLDNAAQLLFIRLKRKRWAMADERSIPAYRVATDRLLRAMAQAKPSNKQEALALSGMGETLYQKFGKELLAEIEGGA